MSVEEELVACLSGVLLDENAEPVEGLDEDLVHYIAGMLAGRVVEEGQDVSEEDEIIDEVMMPFLESVQCPEDMAREAQDAVRAVMEQHSAKAQEASTSVTYVTATRKLRQGVVSMSSDLDRQDDQEDEANRFLWGTDTVKARANTLMENKMEGNFFDPVSSKDKRKERKKQAEKMRKALSSANDIDPDQDDGKGGGLVRMKYNITAGQDAGSDKKKDVNVKNVTVSLDNGTVLLEAGELKFAYQRRYGLIGENGVGKSTLLRAIASQDDSVIPGFPKHLRVLHARQEVPSHIANDVSVMEAVLQSDGERMDLLQAEKDLLAKLEQGGKEDDAAGSKSITEKRKLLQSAATAAGGDMKELNADLKKLDQIYARLQILSTDSAEARAAMILTGLQFTPEMQFSKLSSLSGGWRMRVALAAALFIEPDVCMLDEPTNHLDLEAVLWLEQYLQTYKHTLIVVSHDRGFLNEVCTDIMEFKRRKLTYYRGNFDTYVKLRDENIRNSMRMYQAYQMKREHMMEFIDKFRANAKRATMVQSRIKAVEKMDVEAPEAVEVDQVWRFAIPNSEPLGPPIISINDVYFDYNPILPDGTKKPESQYLLQKVNFGVDLTSKIAILGGNGRGKTTLLNLIMGRLKPLKGGISINGSLRVGHFTQHSADNFDLKLSALENMLNIFEDAEDQEMRSFLGRFQIQGNDALKPMMLLSGGQKSRVAFSALAYKKPHVLVIDEGSNHLSMEAVDALVEAIQDFKGGILVVSHDEYFVSKTCEELWVVDHAVTRFRGDFNEYKRHTQAETQKRVEESLKRLHGAGM